MEDFVQNFVNIIYKIIDAIRDLVETFRGPSLLGPATEEEPAEEPAGE